MNILMSGLDYSVAPVALRERLSFAGTTAGAAAARIVERYEQVLGCVILSTCNRTEIYLSCDEGAELNPAACLCEQAGQDNTEFEFAFFSYQGEDCVEHLSRVAAGLKSQIWGEDQIVSQCKTAVALAREARATDGVLETVFRTAVTAAKEIKSTVRLTANSASSAQRAVDMLTQRLGGLRGRKALVIGNGEMGRLSARLLYEAGCQVEMTLRAYRHGETIVPPGCSAVHYEERYAAMLDKDLVISATTSPHYTITAAQLGRLGRLPPLLVDLAIPRDIDPWVGCLQGTELYNIDQLGEAVRHQVPQEAEEILSKHMDRFRRWADYRQRIAVADQRDQAAPRFPLFIDLRGKKCVVVGGGTVAVRRVGVLRTFGADITVISPEWKGREAPPHWLQRPYEVGDLQGAAIAIAATNDREVNHRVGEDANKMRIPVSVADAQEECSFFFPAVCLGDGMVAGLVSDGIGHRRTTEVARAIRDTMEEFA